MTSSPPPAPQRPKPRLDAANTAFWTGGAQGELRIVKCHDCGRHTHPPLVLCRHCQSENIEAQAMPGTGVIDTFTINHQPWARGLEVPYVIARVAIDGAEGVFLTTNIVNCPVETVGFGDKVRVTFEQRDEIYYPLFEKVEA